MLYVFVLLMLTSWATYDRGVAPLSGVKARRDADFSTTVFQSPWKGKRTSSTAEKKVANAMLLKIVAY